MHVQLSIERITLDGFNLTARERALFRAALEQELGVLLSHRASLPHESAALPALRASDITWHGDPNALGVQVAHAVYGVMSRGD